MDRWTLDSTGGNWKGEADIAGRGGRPQVSIPLSQLIPALVDAVGRRRAWLDDFVDEPITISADLMEIVEAVRFYGLVEARRAA
jgi:hypothetical protein